jgi:hypothetical protein
VAGGDWGALRHPAARPQVRARRLRHLHALSPHR